MRDVFRGIISMGIIFGSFVLFFRLVYPFLRTLPDNDANSALPLLFFVFLIIIVLPFAIWSSYKKDRLWKEFAIQNGYQLGLSEGVQLRSRYINAGKNPYQGATMSKISNGVAISIYDCNTTHGHTPIRGEIDVPVIFTVCEMTMTHNFSDTFIRSKISGYPDVLWKIKIDDLEPISLEGNFDEYFAVYGKKYHASDSLIFLTPDIMGALITSGTDFHMEIAHNKFFVYAHRKERSL